MSRHGKIIIPMKNYAPPAMAQKVVELPSKDDQLTALKHEIADLKNILALAKDRLRRYREVVEDEVKFWEKGLQNGEWEGIEATKRRLSRLRGSLDYLGHAGFGVDEVVK